MKILILSFIFFTMVTYSQQFKNDWTNINSKNWKTDFKTYGFQPFLSKKPQGTLTFKNTRNSSTKIVYYIYKLSDLDNKFKDKILEFYINQSCKALSNKKNNFLIKFSYKEFYYILKPCHNCNVDKNKDCEDLAEQILIKAIENRK